MKPGQKNNNDAQANRPKPHSFEKECFTSFVSVQLTIMGSMWFYKTDSLCHEFLMTYQSRTISYESEEPELFVSVGPLEVGSLAKGSGRILVVLL